MTTSIRPFEHKPAYMQTTLYRLMEQLEGCAPDLLVQQMRHYDTYPGCVVLDGVDSKSFDVWMQGERIAVVYLVEG